MRPDLFLAEYGTRQFEVTVAPADALVAADHAVITREMARAAAHRHGFRACFSPMPEASGVGNGVHIHMSLQDASGEPITHDAAGRMGLSMTAQHFCAGVLHHLPAICAITAPVAGFVSPPDAEPLGADADRHRAAGPRCGVACLPGLRRRRSRRYGTAVQYRIPRLRRGGQSVPGIGRRHLCRRRWPAAQARHAAVGRQGQELPHSLGQALDIMAASKAVAGWFGPVFLEAYLRHKRSEVQHVAEWAVNELCNRYAEVY